MNYSKLYHRLFGRKQPLSRKDVDQYVTKGSSDQKLEEKALQDDFNTDALDGFQESNATTKEMSRLDNYFQKKWSFSIHYVLLVSGVLIVGSLVSVFLNGLNKEEVITTEVKKQPVASVTDTDMNVSEEKVNIVEEGVELDDQPIIAPHSRVLKKERILKRNEETIEDKNTAPSLNDPFIFSLPPKKVESLSVKVEHQFRVSKAEEFYILDFKVIDYSKYRSAFEMEDLTSGIPAKFSNEEKSNTEFPEQHKAYRYDDYLKQTLELLQQERWEIALSRFQVILKKYPKDLNALFYSGISYFNLGEYEKAKPFFQNAYAAEMYNFYEETKWFESLCLEYTAEIKEAKQIWKSIVASNGFYASSAQQKLDESN